MTLEHLTPDVVEAAAVSYDAQDRPVAGGQVVMDFVQVGVLVALLSPREWEEVASYLYGLLERAPLKDGRTFVAHRTVLGALAGELRGYARSAGEPVGLEVDLRAASSRAEERRIRERIADQDLALERHVDDVIDSHRAQQQLEREEPAIAEPTPTETDDVARLL
jgi:hypothetical protein